MRFIRVDMNSKTVTVEQVPSKYLGLGGRGLISTLINDWVPPQCDPLGPENKLIFAPGLLGGTRLVNTSRIAVGAKSPLTGTIKESNAGGTFGDAAGRLGITAIVVEDRDNDSGLSILVIDRDGHARLENAAALKGQRTYALVDRLFKDYGPENAIMCIGPAGEQALRAASIQSTDTKGRPCRAAGRGGLGAVMGAKGLKAIVLDARGDVADAIADPRAFDRAAKNFARAVRSNPFSRDVMPKLGTAGLIAPVNAMGGFPSYNATKGVMEGWEKISGEHMAELMAKRGGRMGHKGCSQCIIQCSNEFVDAQGKYVTSSLEYETIWSMGGMTGIDDLDIIARLDFGHRKFGDGRAAIELVEEIAAGTEFGRMLGNGPEAVGQFFNHHRVPIVKGQSISGYDPRAMQGNAVTYATSPMGADHTAGNLISEYVSGKLDPLKTEGQVEASRNSQIAMALVDSIGLCVLASAVLATPEGSEAFIAAINAKLGTHMAPDALNGMGLKVLKAEREFNRKAGFSNKDDRLPRFFYEEPLPPHNVVVRISDEDMDKTFDF
jgi:aldehyde:ferredoxin oxidoreductase